MISVTRLLLINVKGQSSDLTPHRIWQEVVLYGEGKARAGFESQYQVAVWCCVQ
jgi:hypothetical protein